MRANASVFGSFCWKSGRCLRVLNLQKVGASIENTDNKISDFLFYFWTIELKQKYTHVYQQSQQT